MDEKELNDKLKEIREGMKLFDAHVYIPDYETGGGKLSKKQTEIVRTLFEIFRSLNWQLKFNNYKELRYKESEPIKLAECGTPVKVRSCKKEHGEKTYFGILIGDVALSIGHTIEEGNIVYAEQSHYNPAIFIPELKTVVYGCASWWSRIESEDELKALITDDVISNVWYMKMLGDIARQDAAQQ